MNPDVIRSLLSANAISYRSVTEAADGGMDAFIDGNTGEATFTEYVLNRHPGIRSVLRLSDSHFRVYFESAPIAPQVVNDPVPKSKSKESGGRLRRVRRLLRGAIFPNARGAHSLVQRTEVNELDTTMITEPAASDDLDPILEEIKADPPGQAGSIRQRTKEFLDAGNVSMMGGWV
jgi:hypothetical protein